MNISQDVATIQGHPEAEFDVLIQPVLSERKGGLPVLETTLSIPSPGILDDTMFYVHHDAIWRAMLAAAPQQEVQGE